MKSIKIQITEKSIASDLIQELNNKLPDSTKRTPEYHTTYSEMTSCIEDLTERVKKLAKTGTTIHIQKEYKLKNINVLISLDYPQRKSFFDSLRKLFR